MKEQQANQPASAVLGLHIKAPPPAAHNLHFLHTTKNRSKMAFVILRENGANDLWKTTGDMAVLALYECPRRTLVVERGGLCYLESHQTKLREFCRCGGQYPRKKSLCIRK